eukprot:479525-Rhodomonas_salina.1
MIYTKGIWRLPVLTHESASAIHHNTYVAGITADTSGISADNPYRALLELAMGIESVRESTNPEDMMK